MLRSSPIFVLLLAIAFTGSLRAQQPSSEGKASEGKASEVKTGDWKSTAKCLQASIVTVRIRRAETPQSDEAAKAEDSTGDKSSTAQPSVTVCTGFCVAPGKVITSTLASTDDRIRLTLAGGLQSDARLLAIDEYSGLALLGCDRKELTPLTLATQSPAVGEYVMAGAAWGVDQPVVSLGIVGATDRTLAGLEVPPLLQCDVRTVETSSGSPIANQQAEVVGIVMAIEEPESRRGWTYAIPATHIRRLLRSADSPAQSDETSVVVLKRRRPIVGMVLEGGEEAVRVERITPGGPAEKAGLKVGDQVVAADGVTIRSVYQAVLPTLYKQPGDTVRFQVRREGGAVELEVVLGGGVELPKLSQRNFSKLIMPRVQVGRNQDGQYYAQSGSGHVREVYSPPLPHEAEPPAPATAEQKIELLEKALERYQAVIELQQQQLRALKEAGKSVATSPPSKK